MGTVTVDGAGATFDFGGVMYLGAYGAQSDTSVSFTNGATVNQLGVFQDENGIVHSGIRIEGGGTKLTIDGTSIVNSDLKIFDGNFIVSEAIETVDINGSFNHIGGEIDLQIAGTSSHDKLVTTGKSTLEGELNIVFQDGFAGAASNSFELFNASEFEVGGDFALDVSGLGAGLDAQLQVSGGVASLVLFDSQVADYAII